MPKVEEVRSKEYADEEFLSPRMTRITETGAEVLDETPIAPPVGYKKQPTMVERIREMVRSEKLRQDLDAAGVETFEEADDFDVGDDYEPNSPYEEVIMEPPVNGGAGPLPASAEAPAAAPSAPASPPAPSSPAPAEPAAGAAPKA